MPSHVRTMFESIDRQRISQFIEERKQEDLHLEFKTLPNGMDRDARKVFAKAFSGFSNSDGGVVVWGVDARQDEAGVDAACETAPVTDVQAVQSRMQTLTGEATSPIVDGIEHKVVADGQGDDGYIITLVPASSSGPHMAKLGEDRYYKRSGSGFYRMEHFDLEDVFGRRPKPIVALHAQPHAHITRPGVRERTYSFRVILGIKNSGRGVAKYPSLSLSLTTPYRLSRFGVDGNHNTGLPIVPSSRLDRWITFGGGADHVVHPESVLEVTALHPIDIKLVDGRAASISALRVDYRVAAEGVARVVGSYELSTHDIMELLKATPES